MDKINVQETENNNLEYVSPEIKVYVIHPKPIMNISETDSEDGGDEF